MFVAGKMFENPNEAKAWVEANTQPDERRHWIVLQLEGDEHEAPKGINVEGSVIPSKEKP